MPAISKKGMEMPESPIRKLVPYAEKAKAQGRKVYHLNIGQPDIETPQVALDAIKNINTKVLEYSHSAGNESYRRKLAEQYKRWGIGVDHTQIIVTTGGSEAILFGLMSVLDEGDEVIIPEPLYANYISFAREAGAVVKPVTSYIESGFALPGADEFEKLITPKTKAIIICNPGNPTGYLYSQDELNALAALVKKHDLFLFADEVYREFCYDGKNFTSTLQLQGIEDNVIVVDSVSKRYSMCGVRVGAVVSRNVAVMATILKFAQARLSPPGLGQIAAEAALDTPPEYFTNVVNEYVKRRDLLVNRLNAMEGVFCPTPQGAFYAIARLPIDNADTFCRWLLEDFAYNNATLMLAPATGFYFTKGLGLNEVRIGYVLNETDLNAAMDCLAHALIEYQAVMQAKTAETAGA